MLSGVEGAQKFMVSREVIEGSFHVEYSATALHALTVNDQVCSGKIDSYRGKLMINVCKNVLSLDLAAKPRSCHLFSGS